MFPSPQQKQVIHFSGPRMVVVAAPGTGKTRTIVERMIKLLNEDPSREVSFITFTRASRRDTYNKLKKALGEKLIEDNELSLPKTSTLHTYAKSLVHRYASTIGRQPNFSVLIEDKGEKDLVLQDLTADLDLSIDIEKLASNLRCFRSTNAWPPECCIDNSLHKTIIEYFEFLLGFYNTFDIEGLMTSACEILQGHGIALPPLYLQVDEYQDLNHMDQELVRLTASHPDSQVIVVGDDAQSIYGFRYANYNGLRVLWDSANWEKTAFPDCHRLPHHIQIASQNLIKKCGYLGSNLNPCEDDGHKILTLQCTTSNVQIGAVAKLINTIKTNGSKQDGKSLEYKDFLVLCPTQTFANTMAIQLSTKYSIPAKQQQKNSIPEDCWRLLLVLRMLQSRDSLALRQWLLLAGLSKSKIDELRRDSIRNRKSLYNYCESIPNSIIQDIYTSLAHLNSIKGDTVKFRELLMQFPNLNIQDSLLSDVGLTDSDSDQEYSGIPSIIHSLYEKYGLIDSEVDTSPENEVLVTTLHSAKGLEAEVVFVTWMNKQYMPMANRDINEERRLLYVALTRAKQEVFLTYYETYNPTTKSRSGTENLSPFLLEMANSLDIKRVKAEGTK